MTCSCHVYINVLCFFCIVSIIVFWSLPIYRPFLTLSQTLWIVLEGHYLRGFRSKDSAVPSWSKHMVDCEIKAHDKKYSFKIKVSGKRPYIQLRARDVGEFQCWLAVLQRSKAWNDTTKHEYAKGKREESVWLYRGRLQYCTVCSVVVPCVAYGMIFNSFVCCMACTLVLCDNR